MRARSSLVVAAALLVSAAAVHAGPLADLEREQEALFDRIQPSVVVIATKDGLGSGFFVSQDGVVLTNAHVVGTFATVDVVLPDGTKLVGDVLERAPDDLDLALVQVPRQGTPALALAGRELRVGAWVGAVGHGLGGVWAFNTGMVSNIYPVGTAGKDKPIFQTQIPLNPGNSGGPIFDKLGRVVGVVTSGIKASNSINFAIRVDTALERFPRLVKLCDCLVVEAPAGAPVFVDEVLVGQGPRVIVPVTRAAHDVIVSVGGKVRRERIEFPAVRRLDLRK